MQKEQFCVQLPQYCLAFRLKDKKIQVRASSSTHHLRGQFRFEDVPSEISCNSLRDFYNYWKINCYDFIKIIDSDLVLEYEYQNQKWRFTIELQRSEITMSKVEEIELKKMQNLIEKMENLIQLRQTQIRQSSIDHRIFEEKYRILKAKMHEVVFYISHWKRKLKKTKEKIVKKKEYSMKLQAKRDIFRQIKNAHQTKNI